MMHALFTMLQHPAQVCAPRRTTGGVAVRRCALQQRAHRSTAMHGCDCNPHRSLCGRPCARDVRANVAATDLLKGLFSGGAQKVDAKKVRVLSWRLARAATWAVCCLGQGSTVHAMDLGLVKPPCMLFTFTPTTAPWRQVMEDEKKYILQTYARAPLVLTHGSGARVVDAEGKEYVDMAAGIGEQGFDLS